MTLVKELRNENQEITDTIEVLTHLISHNELRDNPVFCGLLKQFSDTVNNHLNHEGRSVFSDMLTHKDNEIKEAANRFLSNTAQLQKIMTGFAKRWCKAPHDSSDDETFVSETKEVFRLVSERINLEQNKLFPLL